MYDPRISAATAAAEAAEARVDQANTARRPQVQFSIDANDEEDSPTQLANVDLSQQLFDFGQTDARVHVARAQADLAWMEVARSAQDVFAETAVAYANVLEADEQTILQQGFLNEVATRVIAIQSRIDAGLGSITELYSLNRLQAEAEIAIITAQQEAVAARLELERLTGTYFDAVEASGLYDYFDLLPATVEQARFFTDENSPESRLSQQEVWIVEAQVRADNRANLPVLEAYGTYDYGTDSGFAVDGAQSGVRFSLPLYQGGLRRAIADEGAQTVQEALRTRQQAQRLIRQQATQVWNDVDLAERVRQVWLHTETLQAQRVEAVQNELDADLATVEDLLTASQELNETRVSQIRAKYDVARAQVQLLRTVGLASPLARR